MSTELSKVDKRVYSMYTCIKIFVIRWSSYSVPLFPTDRLTRLQSLPILYCTYTRFIHWIGRRAKCRNSRLFLHYPSDMRNFPTPETWNNNNKHSTLYFCTRSVVKFKALTVVFPLVIAQFRMCTPSAVGTSGRGHCRDEAKLVLEQILDYFALIGIILERMKQISIYETYRLNYAVGF